MENKVPDPKQSPIDKYLSSQASQKSLSDDSESAQFSHFKPFFNSNMSGSHFCNYKGLVRLPEEIHCDESFRLKLNQIAGKDSKDQNELRKSSTFEPKAAPGFQTPVKKKSNSKNHIFNAMSTPLKSQTSATRTYFAKNSNSFDMKTIVQSRKLDVKRRFSDPEDGIYSKVVLGTNLEEISQLAQTKKNLSLQEEVAPSVDFEPEDYDSGLLYQAKRTQTTIIQKSPGHYKLLLKPDPKSEKDISSTPFAIKLEKFNSLAPIKNQRFNLFDESKFDISSRNEKFTYNDVKRLIDKLFEKEKIDNAPKKSTKQLFKFLFCGSKNSKKPNDTLDFVIFLKRMSFDYNGKFSEDLENIKLKLFIVLKESMAIVQQDYLVSKNHQELCKIPDLTFQIFNLNKPPFPSGVWIDLGFKSSPKLPNDSETNLLTISVIIQLLTRNPFLFYELSKYFRTNSLSLAETVIYIVNGLFGQLFQLLRFKFKEKNLAALEKCIFINLLIVLKLKNSGNSSFESLEKLVDHSFEIFSRKAEHYFCVIDIDQRTVAAHDTLHDLMLKINH